LRFEISDPKFDPDPEGTRPMLKRIIWALALTIALTGPAAKSLAADPPGAHTADKPAQPGGGAAHSNAEPGTHEGTHDAGHEKGELVPDLGKAASWFSALWVVIIFLGLLAILYPTAWKNVLAGLKAREHRIRTDIAEAEAARTRAEATLREYNQQLATAEQRVRDLIAGAQADGERIAAQIRLRGEQEAQEAKERATREIDAARKQAVAEIYDQAAQLATNVAEKILRRNLNADDQRDLVARSLDQVQNINN
jgi:F-type H+-transporting ATPase subunit b